MKSLTDTFELNNGYKIPCIGFGTWKTADGDEVTNSVLGAIKNGYRHIDTAARYKNEKGVGKAIRQCGIDRSELFITSKVWNTERGYQSTLKAFEKTMTELKLEYLDLYLIHWPASSSRFDDWEQINLDTWKALIELYHAGKIRAIGVSNFMPHHLDALMNTEVIPMVNQIEFHPGRPRIETRTFCAENNIVVEAWSPLGNGKVLSNEALLELAMKYEKSAAQICLRWCLQNQVLPLTKSVSEERIRSNADIFDFVISEEDMERINRLPEFWSSGSHPDKISF